MTKAVIYARYSSHNQREESIEGQLRECNSFASHNDMEIVAEYIDRAISGRTDDRPEFQRMIRDSDRKNFDAVIVYAIDRFARNRYDSATYKMKLKKNGVKVYYAKQSIPDSPEGIILESVMEGYAEYYSENLAMHIKRGQRENALQCKVVNGRPPLGYKTDADKRYEIDPKGAQIVREIFEMYASGSTVKQIIDYCNSHGYKTSYGHKFNKNSLHAMLCNNKYKGVYRYNDIVVEGGVPAIVSKDLFDEVQAACKRNFTTRAHAKADDLYLLTGKLFCGNCKSPMIGESGTSKSGTLYHYYKCSARKRRKNCRKAVEKKDWLEQIVVRLTVQEVLTDARIETIADKAIEIMEKEEQENSVLPSLNHALLDVNKRLKNLVNSIEEGLSTPTTRERLLELEQEKVDLEKRISREQIKKSDLTKDRIVYWLSSFRSGDITDTSYCERVIYTLVNSVYITDLPDNTREITLIYNLSEHNTVKVKCSDLEGLVAPPHQYPNTFFCTKNVFGIALKVDPTSCS